MFIKNKYHKWYYNIINDARQTPRTGYTETHHIIPKCLGGGKESSNLIKLSAREHYIVHLLLTKFTIGIAKKKMFYALHRLSNREDSLKIKTSRLYEYLRINHAKAVSKDTKARIRDVNNIFVRGKGKSHAEIFGKKRSEEIKQSIRKSNKNRVWSEESRQKMSSSQKQRYRSRPESFCSGPKTLEHRKSMSISAKKRHRKKETKQFVWKHKDHGEIFGTRYDLIDLFPDLKIEALGRVISPKYKQEKSHRGWMIKT